MAKFNAKKIGVTALASSLVGGAAAGVVSDLIPIDNSLARNGIVAVAGAGVAAFGGGSEIMKGIGAGLLAVAGADIARGFLGNDSSGVASTFNPGAHAVGDAETRAGNWMQSRTTQRATNQGPRANNVN